MRKNFFIGCWSLCLMAIIIVPVCAEPMVLYDDFNIGDIKPSKWIGYESNNNAARESVRQIRGGRLNLSTCSYSLTDSNTGGQSGGPSLRFTNPGPINAIRAGVQVNKCTIGGCKNNDTIGKVKARLRGCFFNTNVAIPGSPLNDVCADITITRTTQDMDPPDVLHVVGNVWECLDSSCSISNVIASRDLGAITLGQKATLLIRWEKEKNRFIFRRDLNPAVAAGYTVSDAIPASVDRKQLDVYYSVPNCIAASPKKVKMDAFFDDVYVNETAVK